MKHLKTSMYLLLSAVIFISCEKEIAILPENESTSDTFTNSARPMESAQAGELYALYAWDSSENIALYNYNPSDDNISLNEGFTGNTGQNYNFGFDYNASDGLFYFLGAQNNAPDAARALYTFNKENGEVFLIDQILSVQGNINPQDLTFDMNGTLYIVFRGGEINSYNIVTKTMSAFSTVPQSGGVGLTYDFDHNQLIYVTGREPVSLYSIDLTLGSNSLLFTFSPPQCSYGTGHGIEYVGDNKLIATSVYGCDIIYTINIETEITNLLLKPTGSYSGIVDLIYINIQNPDSDGDGFLNEDDAHPNSDMREYLNIDGNSTTIKNKMVKNGSTMMDQLNDLIAQTNEQYNGENYAYHHKRFMTELSQLTYKWRMARLITATQRSQISSIAWGATIPYYNNET